MQKQLRSLPVFLATNTSNEIVRLVAVDPATLNFSPFAVASAYAMLQQVICGKYVGLGVRLSNDNNVVKITEAEKAGLRPGDVISQINREPVSGLRLEQVVERTRGPANTNVILTIAREDQANPVELTVTRSSIAVPSMEAGGSK
jgi:carboxyl-terminal processing protease